MEPEFFGIEGMTDDDRAYRGSRFAEVRDAIFANPYQKIWGGGGEPLLPVYEVTTRSVLRGVLPFGAPYLFRKATERARRAMHPVTLSGTTIPHEVTIKYGGSRILLKPASPGTGVIAGGGVRAVLEAAGVRDILTKSLGSSNQLNMIRATLIGLETMKNPETLAKIRGKSVEEVQPVWRRQRVQQQA